MMIIKHQNEIGSDLERESEVLDKILKNLKCFWL